MTSQPCSLDEIQSLLEQLATPDHEETYYHDIQKQIETCFTQVALPNNNYPDVSKYRVLIILGCPIIKEDLFKITHFFGDSFVFSIAFLYKHLFKYVYNFQEDQILITSICDSEFRTKLGRNFKNSPKRAGFYSKKICDLSSNDGFSRPDANYKNSNLQEFASYNTCTTQVFNTEYTFPLVSPHLQIFPFNRNSLKMLKVDKETELFVFFLNHGSEFKFSTSSIYYDYFLERIIELNSKKNYIFIDCCYSGSFLKLINISEKLQQFFPQANQESDENYNIRLQALFRILSNWEKFEKMQLNDIFEELSLSIKEVKNQIIQDFKANDFFSNHFGNDFKTFLAEVSPLHDSAIVPLHFIQIKQNSIIFCSSEFNLVSFHLPFRFYKIGLETHISSYGTYFSSIILSFFLNPSKISTDVNNSFSAKELLSFIDSQFNEINNNSCSQLVNFTSKQIPKEDFVNFRSLFFSGKYSSTNVFSFCNEISLPSFLTYFHENQNPPFLLSRSIDENTYLPFNIYMAGDETIKPFLSEFVGEFPQQPTYYPRFYLENKNLPRQEPKEYYLLFETVSGFLDLVQKNANDRLQKEDLQPIFLNNDPPNADYFKFISQVDKSTFFLYQSLQKLIDPLFGHRLSLYYYKSRSNFLEMLKILQNNLKKSCDDDSAFETIRHKYIPHIYEAVKEVIKNYYSHIRFCPIPFS